MNTLYFKPHDVLFFKDSRPMGGASYGYGARFPDPHVLNGALHAACHRAFEGVEVGHKHALRLRRDRKRVDDRGERFGALRSVGPYPVDCDEWYFPTPADLSADGRTLAWLPANPALIPGGSSLPSGLWSVVSNNPPSKATVPQWLSLKSYREYLDQKSAASGMKFNSDFFSTEQAIGIELEEGVTKAGQFYSKSQMRLKESCSLGAYVETGDKHGNDQDILKRLFPERGYVTLGGEMRTCTVEVRETTRDLNMPYGSEIHGRFVKWVLLSPAIFPYLPSNTHRQYSHKGGWLPSWVNPQSFQVEMMDGPGASKARRLGVPEGTPIQARLVSALIGKSVIISGWANNGASNDLEENRSGARSTQLAVPAGSVYYFEAADEAHARKLASALNWHGASRSSSIVNRRSGLLGEKGFGIGVCTSWVPFKQQ
jgi:CRISPR-associated protein Cmr3